MDSAKDLVRNALRIEDVIGTYVTLVPAGKNFKACCPFHHEKTPSFQISPDKQMFYCFGCKKGGDIFTFVQEIEHVDFRESLRILADRAGIDLRQSAEITREAKQKKILTEIHEYATRFYQLILSKQPEVISYLKSRGMTPVTIKTWRVGYVPDGFSQVIPILTKKGFSETDLVDSGLAVRSDRGIYDRFRARIMFPISDSVGKVVAFSGRIMPGTRESSREVGKYINSPETLIYHKSSALFGFHLAKPTIAEKKSVIIVEGQFDCILLHQAGFANTVAISGTACTEKHMEQLNRFASEIIIATDADRAGIRSAHQIATLAYQFGLEISVITLPSGKDPADIVTEDPGLFQSLMDARKDYIVFHGDSTAQEPLRERLRSVETYLFPALARMNNHVEQDAVLSRIARMLDVSVESIRKEFERFLKRALTPVTEIPDISPEVASTTNPLTVQLFELALIHQHFPDTAEWFIAHPDARTLAEQQPTVPPEMIADRTARFGALDTVAWKIRLDALWMRIRQIQIDTTIETVRQTMQREKDSEQVSLLQRQLLSLRQEKESLIDSLSD